ncbi:MAG: response regulator transcription factor [Rhodocyclaceae bacterium]|nr:response regulator transcription factor [Rhodocyclaceae bacterium]MCA3030595.1 response regulator transcription factor [Rhodocyclaceae bacterium]MCA3036794.1 response regulator transcription factor [Rhodocyclaceae bacterium]MCA3047360.1 response regulator transcription factor [Rhodocyclaceae bacterium]MCA3048734.1 response regulator transcription factor [Rhodocyclaceae bacterium]
MTTAVLADDEPLLRDELRDALAELWPELDIVAECADGVSALNEIEQRAPDVAFLDIKMPRMSGLEAAEQISTNTLVVFVTAFDDHAIQAFDHGAIDYVMKPIRVARMAKSILRLKQRLADRISTLGATKRVAQALNQADGKNPRYLKFIQASVGKQVRFVMVEEIVYIQSDSKYTRIVTLNSEAFIRKPLSELATELDPEMFWRIHRGTMVNVRSIDAVVRDEIEKMSIKLKGLTDRLEVSRAHQSQFRGL